MSHSLVFAVAAWLAAATPVLAQEPVQAPAAIRQFDLRTIERLGRGIHRQDVAAARATDALLKVAPDPAKEGIVGWLVAEMGDSDRVRFLRNTEAGPEVAYDVDVPPRGAPLVSSPSSRALSAEERAAFAAQQTAARNVPRVCRPRYNAAVLKDPAGDGWLVWLLAPSPAAGLVPVGGHFRFSITADGKTVKRRDALSTSCLVLSPGQGVPKGAKPVGMVVSHVVSPTPVETHVFLQLLHRVPMYVAAGDANWKIEQGRIGRMK
ncbi:MAG: hypothetical protein M3M95_06415 [Pseudomonadota bacterium]|nr:hypothetical protein [Pseudomonadota bacterium]